MKKQKLKITKELSSEIRRHARNFIGGFGMSLELGERVSRDGNTHYYNRYNPLDDEDGADLWSGITWCEFKELEIDIEPGKGVLLDFYVYKVDEFKDFQLSDNLLVEIDEEGVITRVWLTGTDDSSLRYLHPSLNKKYNFIHSH